MKSVASEKGGALKDDSPDIFEAARNDDVYELRRALEDGQSLQISKPNTMLTPLHVAAMRGSASFLKVAMECDPKSSWLQDGQSRTPFDHAAARQDRQSMAYLHKAMYPEATITIPKRQ